MNMEESLLAEIRDYYEKVPLYARMGYFDEGKHMEDFPLIEKDDVIENDTGVISPEAIPLYYQGKLLMERTSGSTGKYLETYWMKSDYIRSMLPLWLLRKKYYGICPEDRMCYFYTILQVGSDLNETVQNRNARGYSKSDLSLKKLREIYCDMQQYRPVWLLLQPSMAVLLCSCVRRYGLDRIQSLRYIELSGEILTDDVRKEIENVFGCRTANQYGANEFNSIALECPYGNMHILTANVYLEVLREGEPVPEGTDGELYITTRTNRAMPLIRYRIGDTGHVSRKNCACGNHRPCLSLTSGRANDFILTGDGERRTPYVLVRAIDNVNYQTDGIIRQFQIRQQDVRSFRISFCVEDIGGETCAEIEKIFLESVSDRELRNCQYTFEYYGELFQDEVVYDERGEASGKFMYFKRCFEKL